MNNSNPSPEGKTKNITLGLVFAWIFGVIVGISGIANLFSQPIVGLLCILCALIALPPVSKFVKEKMHFSLSKGLKITAVVILLVIISVVVSKNEKGSAVTTAVTVNVSPSVTSSTTEAIPVATPSQAPIIVSASKLSSDYQSNQVSADAEYKGNLVQVTGTVYNIGKDILGNPYVELQDSEYDPIGVQCMVSQDIEPTLASLSKGQIVTLEGTVSGEVIINVEVDGCRIVK